MIVAGGQVYHRPKRPGMGQLYFDSYGNPVWDTINRGIDVVGAAVSNSPYYSPDDPRYQQDGYYQTGGAYPAQYAGGGAYVPGTVSTQGFQINWWTAALIGLLVGSFLLGKRR